MRVLFATAGYPPQTGGVEQATYRLAREFLNMGHAVGVIAPRLPGMDSESELDGVHIWRLPYPMPQCSPREVADFVMKFPGAYRRFARIVEQFAPDVLNSHFASTTNSLYSVHASSRLGVPLVVSMHGSDVAVMPRASTAWRMTLLAAVKHADVLTACSDYVRRIAAGFTARASQAVVIRNGVDVSGNGHSEEKPVVLGVGRLVRDKGFDVLIRAFREVASGFPHYQLCLIGSGPEEQSLHQLAESLGVGDRVFFFGQLPHDRVQEAMQSSAIIAAPSRKEGLGIAILEAMALGKPVVASAVGGIPEIVRPGITGFLVAPEDDVALAAAVMELAADPALRSRLGKAGLEVARTYHTWGAAASAYIKCYQDAIAARNAAAWVKIR